MTLEQRMVEMSAKLDQIIICLATLAKRKSDKPKSKKKRKDAK